MKRHSNQATSWFCMLLTISACTWMPASGFEGNFALALQDQSLAPADPSFGVDNTPNNTPNEDSDNSDAVPPTPPPAPNPSNRGRQSLGAVAASYSAAPEMIGDFFGGTFMHLSTKGQTVAIAGGDRRFKVAENVSPMPRDRVYFNYNYFSNALVDSDDQQRSLNRYALGIEKTFARGQASVELRLPIARGLDSNQAVGNPDPVATELGNLGLALKFNFWSGRNWIVTGGSSLTLPTGDDFRFYDYPYAPNNLELLVENDAVHLAPFLGWLIQPSERTFFQGFLQVDIDLNGNDVFTSSGFEGVIQDQNLLFFDLSIGRWIYQNRDRRARLSRVAAIGEVHYTSTLNDTDYVCYLANPYNRMDVVNASAALHFQLQRNSFRVGAAAPLRGNEERFFDGEVIFQFNHNY